MNKWLKITILPLLVLLLLPFLPIQALAAGESVTAEIPFTVENAPGTVVMEAASEGAPLPRQAVFADVTEGTFSITFTEAGDYLYKVYQRKGTQSGISYDAATVYEVGISVIFDSNGELACVMGISKQGSTSKAEAVVFENASPYAYLDITKVAKSEGREIEGALSEEEFLYEIRVENKGKALATDVEITDTLPTEQPLLIVGTINNGGKLSDDGKSITWNVGDIAPGGSKTVSFTVFVPQVWTDTSWINTAVAFYGGGAVEAGDSSGTATTETATATAVVSAPAPNVIIEKTQSLNGGKRTRDIVDVQPGDTVTYYLTVTNNSEATAVDVVVTDDIPSPPMLELSEDSISDGGESDGNTITWKLGDLTPGQSVTLSFTVAVPKVSEYTIWTNQAFGSYTGKGASSPGEIPPDRISLISNPVEARYETEVSPTPETKDDPTPDDDGSTPGADDPGTPGSGPQTGDNSRIGMWVILMVGSFAGLILLALVGRRKRDKRKKR